MGVLENDFIRLKLNYAGDVNIPCKRIRLDWPPPERICLDHGKIREAVSGDDENNILIRKRHSQLSDEVAQSSPCLARGAEYEYLRGRRGVEYDNKG
jgi:hypothetical protein